MADGCSDASGRQRTPAGVGASLIVPPSLHIGIPALHMKQESLPAIAEEDSAQELGVPRGLGTLPPSRATRRSST